MATATLSKPTNVKDTLADIEAAVEKIKNDQPQQFPEAASIGDAVRQGDIYIQLVDPKDVAALEGLYTRVPDEQLANHLQLAPGNTKGSRHIIQHAEGLSMWLPARTDEEILKFVYAQHKEPITKGERLNRWTAKFLEERENIGEAMALAGPIFKCDTPNAVTHPEHGDWLLPAGFYRVIFQRTVDEQERIRRVLD